MSRDLVLTFLQTMEARDLPRAQTMLAPGAQMVFPGGKVFTTLAAMVAWSQGRYRAVRKTYHGFDEFTADGLTVVYCFGVLNGEGLDGSSITDVRFVDRFEVRDGKITDQKVWNDLGSVRSDFSPTHPH